MIYAIENGQKIPLGTQFDNSWEIEYDRDLSSQLANRKEWTAPEDCWFQYHSIFYSKPGATDSNNNVTLTIQLNGIVVANTDNILDSGGGTLYEITASVLMKKGDVISYKNTVDGIQAPPFTAKCGKIFPIHRILSKDDGPKIWNLSSDMSVAKELRITLNTKNYAPIFVSTHSDAAGYINTQPAPCVVFVSYANEIKTIPENVRTSFTVKNNNVLTLSLPRDAEYPTWSKRAAVTEVIPGTIKSVEIVEA